MDKKELQKLMLENAKLAGLYKGYLEGLMMQATEKDGFYVIEKDVFEKVKKLAEDIAR